MDGPEARGFAACALGGDPHAAAAARDFTRSTLCGWDMAAIADSATTIVSELVSNATRHAVGGLRRLPPPLHPVWLGLLRQGTSVLCTVSDPSTDGPVMKEPDHLAESGRGLHIIDALSESWGWTPDFAGKAVWAMVSVSAFR